MIRLPRELGLQVMVLLANMKGRFTGDLTYAELRRWAFENYTNGTLPHQVQIALQRARANDEAYGGTTEEVLVEAAEAINTDYDRARTALGDLADKLADILTSTYPRNVLSGGQLRQLRKALLRADELQGLPGKLRKQELSCGGCGHRFTDMEMATLRQDGEGVTLYCKRCLSPSYVACSGCEDGYQPLSKAQMVALSKTTECTHVKVATDDVQADLNAPPPPVVPRATRRMTDAQLRQWTQTITLGTALDAYPTAAPARDDDDELEDDE